MYFYEAIALGRMILKPKFGYFNDRQGNGCALGMAEVALGYSLIQRELLDATYPWLRKTAVPLPCQCDSRRGFGSSRLSADIVVAHIFDYHVVLVAVDPKWTMEELIDWVKQIDPTIALDSPQKEIKLTANGEPDAGKVCTDTGRTDSVQVLVGVSSPEIQL